MLYYDGEHYALVMLPIPPKVFARALGNVAEQGECVVSLYSTTKQGYAQIGWQQEGKTHTRLVHRVAWENANGQIPVGMTIDHICRTRNCLRISHLRLLSPSDNSKRNAPGRDFPIGWACRRGHPASSQIQKAGKRGRPVSACAECLTLSRTKYREAHKGEPIDVGARKPLTSDDARHGRETTYVYFKCRCRACTDASAQGAKRRADVRRMKKINLGRSS